MKPTSSFKLSSSAKRMIAMSRVNGMSKEKAAIYKKMLIEAEVSLEVNKKKRVMATE